MCRAGAGQETGNRRCDSIPNRWLPSDRTRLITVIMSHSNHWADPGKFEIEIETNARFKQSLCHLCLINRSYGFVFAH